MPLGPSADGAPPAATPAAEPPSSGPPTSGPPTSAPPSGLRTVRTLGVLQAGEPGFSTYEEPPPVDGQFRVDTLCTALSAGTELTFLKGTNPYLHARWDAEVGVFRAGEPSRRYPVPVMGYMEVGRVVESRTPEVAVGQVVAAAYGHRTGHVLDARPTGAPYAVLPDGFDPVLGVYVAQMGPICANGLLHAAADSGDPDPDLGDGVRGQRVLVTGGGVVGLLTGLLARVHGAAEVVLADPDPRRLQAAEALGLRPLHDDGDGSVWRDCTDRWRSGPQDAGADLVFQCRGQAAALATALRALRPQGTVVDLAFYQGGAPELRLGEEFHHKGLVVRCAQIARVPRGMSGAWDRARLQRETVALLTAHGDAVRRAVVTDVVPLDDAPAFLLDLAARRRSSISAVFGVAE